MQKYILTCCSTVDMNNDYMQKRNLPYVSFTFTIDNVSLPDDMGKSMHFDEFYNKIKNGSMPITSMVNSEQFVEFFDKYLSQGMDVLHVSFSSGLSGSYQGACLAKKELSAKYPNRKIIIIDSLGASSGYGLLMDMAADRRDEGYDIDKLANWIEENKLNIHHWFFSTDLKHYKRGGRISANAAFFGTLLKICPLMNMSYDGKLIIRQKITGKKVVIKKIVEKMLENAENGKDYIGKCFISESACMEDAEAVAALVKETFPKLNGPVLINSIGTVVGSHTGPGTVALFFVGNKRVD